MEFITLFTIAILIISIVAHEVAHGFVAYYFGDPTAKIAGRLTANPVSHTDPIGSVLVPLLFYFTTSGGVAGWAKPVPYNPYMLRGRFAETAVAVAGVATNMLIACVAALVIAFLPETIQNQGYFHILYIILSINVGLAVFNLLPFPPFDGLRIITSVAQGFGVSRRTFAFAEHPMWIIVSLVIAFNMWPIIRPIVSFIINVLV